MMRVTAPTPPAQSGNARDERVVRVMAFTFIAAALVVVPTRSTGDQRFTYIVIAAGLCLFAFAQDLLPISLLGRRRLAVEAAALLLFISIVVALTGGYTSPLTIGYVLLIAGAALWRDPKAPLLLGGAAFVAYAGAVLGAAASVGAALPPEALVRVGLIVVALGVSSCIAALISLARRHRSGGASFSSRAASLPIDTHPAESLVHHLEVPAQESVVPVEPPADDSPPAVVVSGEAPWERSALAVTAPPNALDLSIRGLLRRAPEMSAFRTLSRPQVAFLLVVVAILAVGLVIAPLATLIAVNVVITAIYLLALAFNIAIFRALLRKPPMVRVSDEEAFAVPDNQLPTYTVLVAAYHEGEIINRTIRALEELDYPRDRLDILLLLEADDSETIQAARTARAARPASQIRIVVVPDAQPKTKPKACNYGLQLSSGELVTIFDAEDRPDRLQLRRAALAFSRMPPEIACLQAQLQFHNERQNVLTRWFSAEYVTWFAAVLPALVRLNAPVPLGGTSMHVRRDVLEAVGAWDPFNVTEDADLGIRLRRFGYRTAVLDSVTLEEANSDFINWVKQRSRWYKGYLQTWLVHMRQPRRLWREMGPAGFLGFQVVIGSTPLLALLNPLFWLLTALWFLSGAHIVQVLFPAFVFYPALVSVVFGNFLALYRTMVAVRLADHPGLVIWALVVPFYWVFMSIAALRAFVQLFVAPSFWEKTMHGLDLPGDATPLGWPR
jgi:glycosyltransferase XagB